MIVVEYTEQLPLGAAAVREILRDALEAERWGAGGDLPATRRWTAALAPLEAADAWATKVEVFTSEQVVVHDAGRHVEGTETVALWGAGRACELHYVLCVQPRGCLARTLLAPWLWMRLRAHARDHRRRMQDACAFGDLA